MRVTRCLLPLLLLTSSCGLIQSELVQEQIPAMVAAIERDAETRIVATEKLSAILDWIEYILAGCAAGIVALVFTASKTARRWLIAKAKKPRRRRATAK